MKRRIMSFLLAFVLLAVNLPMTAFALDAEAAPTEATVEEISEITAPEIVLTTPVMESTSEITSMDADNSATSGTCGDNLTWVLDADGILTISGTGKMADFCIGDGLLTRYEVPWEEHRNNITAVIISEGVTHISNNAFRDCANLKRVVLPRSVVIMEGSSNGRGGNGVNNGSAFYNCNNIKTAGPIGSGCDYEFAWTEEIPANAFLGLRGLQSVMLPQTITSIGTGAFEWSSLQSITIPASVTSIGTYAFQGCYIESITFQSGAVTVGDYAFDRCSHLTDVYFNGTDVDWESFSENNVGKSGRWGIVGNQALLDATIHCNGSSSTLADIRYYSAWNEAHQLAYFGPADIAGCKVTEETAHTFTDDPKALLGGYVLVETKTENGQEILLSMRAVESKVGTVTAADVSNMIVNGKTYNIPANVVNPESYANQFVLYHVYNGNLAGIEILKTVEGFLTYYNKDQQWMKIKPYATNSDSFVYQLSPLADENTVKFLELTGKNGETDVTTLYAADSNRYVYQMSPYVERDPNGFSSARDGWCILNSYPAFGYSANHLIELIPDSGAYWPWGGNCFGLSMLAVAEYNGQINLKDYFFNMQGENLNEFGYQRIVDSNFGTVVGRLYTLTGNVAIIEIIERAQMSQAAVAVNDVILFENARDFDELIEYLSQPTPNPLVVRMDYIKPTGNKGHHAIVTDTTYKPIYIGNYQFVIMCYDSNSPQLTNKIEGGVSQYERPMSYILIDTQNDTWTYIHDGTEYEGSRIRFYDISELDSKVFTGRLSLAPHAVTLLSTSNNMQIQTQNGKPIAGIKNGVPSVYAENVVYDTYCESVKNSETQKGWFTLPKDSHRIEAEKDSTICYAYGNDVFTYQSDQNTTVLIDAEAAQLTMHNPQEKANVQCSFANADGSMVVLIEGELSADGTLCLEIKGNTAKVTTDVSPENIEATVLCNGEETEVCIERTPKFMMGDVNGDGFVDSYDAALILKYDVMLIGDSDLDLAAADVSGDGFVDSYDASLILKYDVMLIHTFPAEK